MSPELPEVTGLFGCPHNLASLPQCKSPKRDQGGSCWVFHGIGSEVVRHHSVSLGAAHTLVGNLVAPLESHSQVKLENPHIPQLGFCEILDLPVGVA